MISTQVIHMIRVAVTGHGVDLDDWTEGETFTLKNQVSRHSKMEMKYQ